jgi:acyl-ACP thioesterase
MTGSTIPELVALPTDPAARLYRARRRTRLGDVTPTGRARLDAIARWLQDTANDDAFDAALPQAMWWVVRRTIIRAERFPVMREEVELTTWCSGFGSRWAERRTRIVGDEGALVEAASLWVHIDEASGRPAKLPAAFHELYAPAAAGREVSARRAHPDPPADAVTADWPLRAVDFDVLEHVNNAVYLAPVEEIIGSDRKPATVDVEYREGVRIGEPARVAMVGEAPGEQRLWILAGDRVAASAVIAGR